MRKRISELLKRIYGEKYTLRRKIAVPLTVVLVLAILLPFFTVGPGAPLAHRLLTRTSVDYDYMERIQISLDNAITKKIKKVWQWELDIPLDYDQVLQPCTDFVSDYKNGVMTEQYKNYGSVEYMGNSYVLESSIHPYEETGYEGVELEGQVAAYVGTGEDKRLATETDAEEDITLTLYRIRETAEGYALVGFIAGDETLYLYSNESYGAGMELADYLASVGIDRVMIDMMTTAGISMYYTEFPLSYVTEVIAPAARLIDADDPVWEGAMQTGLNIVWRGYMGDLMSIRFWDNGCITVQYSSAYYITPETSVLCYSLDDPELAYGTGLITYLHENGYKVMYGWGWLHVFDWLQVQLENFFS
ncbi:MAG: hypothetical protein LUE29_04875 [Lachnospiraceae bacterium]|nr:hypothetical protein [Lachnospiraceae bacterium]